jgi:hypothetical protein
MPSTTTCGTEGYTPPFVWQRGIARPEATWCAHADRFPLALLCVEFLVLDKGAPLGAEGGMFDQRHLRARSGATIRYAVERLRQQYPGAIPLFEQAIHSQRCSDCPAPESWLAFCDAVGGPAIAPPPLSSLEGVVPADFIDILRRRTPAAPVWPAPPLDQLPLGPSKAPSIPPTAVTLPPDPWLCVYRQQGRGQPSPLTGLAMGATEDLR